MRSVSQSIYCHLICKGFSNKRQGPQCILASERVFTLCGLDDIFQFAAFEIAGIAKAGNQFADDAFLVDGLPSVSDLPAMLVLQVSFNSVKMKPVNDLSVISILLKVLLPPVKLL